MSDVVCGQQWYVGWILFYIVLRICVSINYMAYLHRLIFEPIMNSDTCQ
jgi:hypothetical protein